MLKDLNQTWNLESFFPGGSESKEFAAFLDQLAADVETLASDVRGGAVSGAGAWAERIGRFQDVAARLRHAGAFVSCLSAQNVDDKHARVVGARVGQIQAAFASCWTELDTQMLAVPNEEWNALIQSEELKPLAYNLTERRQRAREMLPPEQEKLVNALTTNGYHGWSDLYDLTTGRMSIIIEKDGKPVRLSPGQAANRMADADPKFRAHVMERWESAWQDVADYCALALNNLGGYRLNLYKQRGWDSFMQEPLEMNRMSAQTLDTMWETIDRNKERMVKYLRRKKDLLGLDKLGWQDVGAPIGRSDSKMSYDEAANFICEQFGRFSPKMAAFAEVAFRNRWIEAEDRPGKRMGGFCTSFPVKKESRIFVTFSGTMGNTATVAHELGHGFHQSVMNDLPPLAAGYAMAVAETASTFAEMVVADAAVAHARNADERLVLMEDKLARAVSLLMNIEARFIFETHFYEERRKGMVPAQRLNELMVEAQKEAFAGALDGYHPTFWASKLHFYNTRVPFYNFPYTFGFLFSAGVYAKAREVGPTFEDKYADLLRDTGRMRVEDLAKRHLDVELTKPDFWQKAIDSVLSDYDEFMRLTAK
ncbi:MAG: M3 family oligoendopeptidase [Chloroflexota bacterium]